MGKDEAINIKKNSDLNKKRETLQNIYFLKNIYKKLIKQIMAFGDIETEKHKFHNHKNPILIDEVYIDKILISNKISFDRKGF